MQRRWVGQVAWKANERTLRHFSISACAGRRGQSVLPEFERSRPASRDRRKHPQPKSPEPASERSQGRFTHQPSVYYKHVTSIECPLVSACSLRRAD